MSMIYPNSEIDRYKENEALFAEWSDVLMKSSIPSLSALSNHITKDGFYPFFSKQKVKILYVGRDSYGMGGANYLEVFFNIYRKEKHLCQPPIHINRHAFHSKMLRIAWAVNNGFPAWQSIPNASKIGDTFGEENGLSFAFINIGKVRAEDDFTHSHRESIESFCVESAKSNLIQRQIDIIEPDVIISMKLGDWGIFQYMGETKLIERNKDISVSELKTSKRTYHLLDCWHFSAVKSHNTRFYEPISNALKNLGYN